MQPRPGDVIADEPEEILEDSDDFQLAEPDAAYDEAEDAKTQQGVQEDDTELTVEDLD